VTAPIGRSIEETRDAFVAETKVKIDNVTICAGADGVDVQFRICDADKVARILEGLEAVIEQAGGLDDATTARAWLANARSGRGRVVSLEERLLRSVAIFDAAASDKEGT